MIGDGFGVGWFYIDVYQCYVQVVFVYQVVGGYLWQVFDVVGVVWCGCVEFVFGVVGLDKVDVVFVVVVFYEFVFEGSEFIDVVLVVGEQDEVLEVFWMCGCVVVQVLQGEVDLFGCEY